MCHCQLFLSQPLSSKLWKTADSQMSSFGITTTSLGSPNYSLFISSSFLNTLMTSGLNLCIPHWSHNPLTSSNIYLTPPLCTCSRNLNKSPEPPQDIFFEFSFHLWVFVIIFATSWLSFIVLLFRIIDLRYCYSSFIFSNHWLHNQQYGWCPPKHLGPLHPFHYLVIHHVMQGSWGELFRWSLIIYNTAT